MRTRKECSIPSEESSSMDGSLDSARSLDFDQREDR